MEIIPPILPVIQIGIGGANPFCSLSGAPEEQYHCGMPQETQLRSRIEFPRFHEVNVGREVIEDEPPQCPHTTAALTTGSVPLPVPTGVIADPIEFYADFRRLRCQKESIPRPLSIIAQVEGSGTAAVVKLTALKELSVSA